MRKNTSTCLRVRKVCCLILPGTQGTFRTLFLRPCSLYSLLGATADPATLRLGVRRIRNESRPLPTPPQGVRSDLGCCTSEPVAAGSPRSVPAQCRFGNRAGKLSLILAERIDRHTQAVTLCHRLQPSSAVVSAVVIRKCSPMTGSIPILRSY